MKIHTPVLVQEVLHYLSPVPNAHFIDGTIGTGGHAEKLLERTSPHGILVGCDLDTESLTIARRRLERFGDRVLLFEINFQNLPRIIRGKTPVQKFDGFLLDLGISSFELASPERGFSFRQEGPLDMRLNRQFFTLTAKEIVNEWPEIKIRRILEEFGEERLSRFIARKVVERRKQKMFETTTEFAEFLEKIYPRRLSVKKIHPATKVFQALRIAVNRELESLRNILPESLQLLKPGGRIVVLSFHSLEDRIVKQFFQKESKDCWCPPEIPVCRCAHRRQLHLLTTKPIIPTDEEVYRNEHARSAKLRAAEKI